MATTGRRPFFLSAAADRAGSSTRTTDVDSLVRDKGRQASQKILRYLRRSCSSRAMRLDLVMLIIARKIRGETEVCAGGWAESGQRARAWEEKGKTLGNPPQRGSAARWGQPGLPGPNATSQAWRAPPGWDARAAETWESIGSLQACQRPRPRSESATKNRVPRAWVGRKELDHGIVRGSVPCRRIHSLEANATKKTRGPERARQ